MNKTISTSSFSLALLITAIPAAGSTTAIVQLLANFNVVTTGDYNPQQADSEGRALVGGTFNVTAELPFNSNDIGPEFAIYAQDFSFSANARLQVQNGSVATPANPDASRFSFTNSSTLVSGSAGQTAFDEVLNSVGIMPGNLTAALTSGSAAWAALDANSTIQNPGQNLRFDAGPGVSVYNITASDVFAQNYNPQFSLDAQTQAILINVSGTIIDNTSFAQNINNMPEDIRRRLIWHFPEATTVNLSKFGGAIVAPNADIEVAESNGSVIGKSVLHTDELHLDPFLGIDPIPEPHSTLLCLLSGTLLLRRRR